MVDWRDGRVDEGRHCLESLVVVVGVLVDVFVGVGGCGVLMLSVQQRGR